MHHYCTLEFVCSCRPIYMFLDDGSEPQMCCTRESATAVSLFLASPNQIDEVIAAAKRAKEAGSTRFCMGAAWRELGNKKKAFNNILDMVSSMSLGEVRAVEEKWIRVEYMFQRSGGSAL